MRQSHILLVIVALLAVVLSGCVSNDPAPEPEDDGTTQVGPAVEEGAIRGAVVDAETLAPLGGISMLIADTSTEVRSDAEGSYAFERVPSGRYRVVAISPEYETKASIVDVEANRTHWLNFSLEPVVEIPPDEETLELNGFYECAFGTAVWIDSCTFVARTVVDLAEQNSGQDIVQGNDGNNKRDFFWETRPGVAAVVQELVWETAATSTTDRMRLYLGKPPIDPVEDSSPTYVASDGTSPIRQIKANLTDEEWEVFKAAGYDGASRKEPVNETMLTRVYLPFDAEPAVALQQPFTVYVTIFYGYVPAADYTAIPE